MERIKDMERFIAQKGLGNLLTTKEGIDFLREYIFLVDSTRK